MPLGLMKLDMGKRYLHNWHLRVLNDKLMSVADGTVKRLMIFMPPRHAKSSLVSHYFTAWFLGNYPDMRVILTSHEADFAASWGRKVRDTLEQYGPELFGVSISEDSSASNRWDIKGHLGGMTTAGAGGSITGKGANLLIIDDPIKNAEEANSKTVRDKIWDWFKSTAYTRLEPDGRVIIIQTRWHEDDLSGRILQEMETEGEQWEIISFPAIAEEDEYYNGKLMRRTGEPLWPERFSLERLLAIKQTLGAYWWSALYQQRPSQEGGGIFKRSYFRYFSIEEDYYVLRKSEGVSRVPKNECRIFQTVDLAASTKTVADYFVITTWAVTPNKDLLLLDVIRTRVEGPDQVPLLWQAFWKWRPSYILVETVAYQLTFLQAARREGLPVRGVRPDKDKVSKALPLAARYESGSVYHLAGAVWLADYETELLTFPNGEHDDQVDAASYAAIELTTRTEPRIIWL
ncbi:phage terminase large subunit [Pseudothermotoga sp.]|uniref:phage terminase large subunit n=1 Tax=Pseudothermotoga sp. TaxID=2033661 RepID=UPI00257E93CB|nr:phage terminase large subunit [Pseudothermotoga sp.]